MAVTSEPDPRSLLRLARATMPYGKYAGRRLVDLPEAYVIWLVNHQLPEGDLGRQILEIYEIKVNGLEGLVRKIAGGGNL